MSISDQGLETPVSRRSDSLRLVVRVLAGASIGMLLGLVVDAAAWLFAFGSTLSGGSPVSIPFIVTTYTSGQDTFARSGLGVLLLPIGLALVGVAVGLLVSRSKSRSQR